MEKNIFISRTNLSGSGKDLFINDFKALGQHLQSLDSKWSYTAAQHMTYGVYMRLAYDNKFSITSYIDKDNSSSALWAKERLPALTQRFDKLADPSLMSTRTMKYTLITLLPAPSDRAD